MGLRINQNIAAMNAYRNLSVTDGQMAKSLEKLSSGFRINRAADDAAGLGISEGLRAQVGGLKVAVRNAQDGISVVQTAEGALNEVHSILGRMRDLAVQASSSGSQDTNARTAAQTELTQLNAELDRIGSTTKFGSVNLLNGQAASVTGAITGGTTGALAGAGFTIAGTFGGVAVSQAATVANGTYASAGSYQTALQTAIDNALTTDGAAAGSLKATVSDVGGGVWKVELNSASVGSGNNFVISATAGNVGVANGTSSNQANSLSQTFQIGANNGETLAVSFNGISSSILGTSQPRPGEQRRRRPSPPSTPPSGRSRPTEPTSVPSRTASSTRSPTCRSPRRTSRPPRAGSVTRTWPRRWCPSPGARSSPRPVRPCWPRPTRRRSRSCSSCVASIQST